MPPSPATALARCSPSCLTVNEDGHMSPERPPLPRMGMPRRITVTSTQGVDVMVVVTVVRDSVWMTISPPFTWEAIMTPGTVDEVIHALELARDEATKTVTASLGWE